MLFEKDQIYEILSAGSFPHSPGLPIIVVFRHTDSSGEFCPNTGDNCCDQVALVDADGVHAVLTGRSFASDKYQARQLQGISNANYIASGYYRNAWGKGTHFKLPALVQIQPFVIWRSKDMEYLDGDGDDWVEHSIVADNFHGWAPESAGCVTVQGDMRNPSGDWKIALNWIYTKHRSQSVFAAAILEHDDLDCQQRLRVGSSGPYVRRLQNALELAPDGEFGPLTHATVRAYQQKQGVLDTGIILVSDIPE